MKILRFKTYLSAIKKSPGTRMFQNIFVEENGKIKDILNNGDISCAYFVSSVLYLSSCIKKAHATVTGLEKELQSPSWEKIPQKSIKEGDIIVWEKAPDRYGDIFRHIGFYIGKNYAVSNKDIKKTPIKHHYTSKNKRKIETIYRYTDWK